jgi:ribosome-binding factor A
MSIRTEKVGEELKQRISIILTKDLSDLDLGLVSVTKVQVTPDLRNAKVFLSFLGNKLPVEKCLEKIDNRKKLIRLHLASNIYLKRVPELSFQYDDSMAFANKIDELIKEIHKNDKKTDDEQ